MCTDPLLADPPMSFNPLRTNQLPVLSFPWALLADPSAPSNSVAPPVYGGNPASAPVPSPGVVSGERKGPGQDDSLQLQSPTSPAQSLPRPGQGVDASLPTPTPSMVSRPPLTHIGPRVGRDGKYVDDKNTFKNTASTRSTLSRSIWLIVGLPVTS
jgi:hypothetical protein